MNTIRSFVKRHSFITFAVLSYLLSWWSVPFANGRIIPYGPALAAVIVLAITSGRPGLRNLWHMFTNWRISWYWYVIGPGLVTSYIAGAYLINLLLGASVISSPQLPSMATLLQLLLLGGLWEEPGWSGYALPTLQERFSGHPNGALMATLGTGVVRAIWHLPLVIYGHIPWYDALFFTLAFQIMISWLFNGSGGSVLIVMLFHFASNVSGAIMSPVFTGAGRTSYYVLFVILAWVIALVILWRSNLKLGLADIQKKRAIVGHQAA
jgi:uncharacterized protein